MSRALMVFVVAAICLGFQIHAQAATAPAVSRVFLIIFENTDASKTLKQPFFAKLASDGAYLENYRALVHPSQPNYIGLVAGDTLGVKTNSKQSLEENHLGDLIEAAGKNWRVYAEDYPESYTEKGKCFTGSGNDKFVRKHVPFLSFKNVNKNDERCSQHIFSDSKLEKDVAENKLVEFSLFIPNDDNNAHDTSVGHANDWLERRFGPLLKDSQFMKDTLFIITFDESSYRGKQYVYTALLGPMILPGTRSSVAYNHYDLLRTIEEVLGLKTLGRNDAKASVISGIWK